MAVLVSYLFIHDRSKPAKVPAQKPTQQNSLIIIIQKKENSQNTEISLFVNIAHP